MTVANTSSSSPNTGHFIIQSPSIAPMGKAGDDDNNEDDERAYNDKAFPSHTQPCHQHPGSELHTRKLVDTLLEEGERHAVMELLSGAAFGDIDGMSSAYVIPCGNTLNVNALSRDLAKTGEPTDEAVCGWDRASGFVVRKTSVNRSTGATGAGAAGRKRVTSFRSGFSSSSAQDLSAYGVSSAPQHGGVIRCISEDYVLGAHSHRKAAWKSNVEPGTYRYIVNNGIYRSTKFASLGGDWVTAKRSRGGAGAAAAAASSAEASVQKSHSQYRASLSSSLSSASGPRTSEVRQRQSMIKRDLNRYTFLNNGGSDATGRRIQFEHSTIKPGDQLGEMSPSPAALGQGKKDLPCFNENKLPHQHQKHDESQQNQQQHQHQQQQQRLQPPLPPWSSSSSRYSPDTRDPQLVKSASDLFVENFSSKIDALEKEDPTTAGTPDCLPRPGTNPTAAMTSLQSSSVAASSRRNGHKQDQNHLHPPPMSSSSSVSDSRSSAMLHPDDISRDVFTVKPAVGIRASDQLPLKPLEKLTPQQQKKAALKGNFSGSDVTDSVDGGGGESRSEATSSASHSHIFPMAYHSGTSNCSTPIGGAVSPPSLPASFMTAMNAFSQIHHHYHLADAGGKRKGQSLKQQSKSSPPTFRSTQSNGSNGDKHIHKHKTNYSKSGAYNGSGGGGGIKYTNYQPTQSDTDSLSSVKNALTLTNNDIEKMRMNHLAVRDYNRYISTRPKPQLTGLAAKPPAGNKKSANNSATHTSVLGNAKTLGLRPFNTTSAPQVNKQPPPPAAAAPPGDDLSGVMSDSDTESFLAGTSVLVGRGARERGMSLPEISGKRLSVATTSQRML